MSFSNLFKTEDRMARFNQQNAQTKNIQKHLRIAEQTLNPVEAQAHMDKAHKLAKRYKLI